MKTKALSLILILMVCAPVAMAQTKGKNTSKISIGVLGGINFQNLNGKASDGTKLENDLALGYHVGVNVQIPIATDFFFQSGLLFTTKGAKNTIISVTSKYRISYLELPLNLVYKAVFGDGDILIGFGPYLGYGIGGKIKPGSLPVRDIKFKNVVETGDPNTVSYYRALDAGANIFVGYELSNGIFCQLNSQLGLIKINPEDKRITNDETSIKNTGFGLSVGYRF